MIEDTEELSKPRTEQQVGEDSVRRLARGASDELVRIVLFGPIPSPGTAFPPRENFFPRRIELHRPAPNQDRPCCARRSGLGQRPALGIAQNVLRTRPRERKCCGAHGRDLMSDVS